MSVEACIAYVVRTSREEPPRLFSRSVVRLSLHEAPPLVAPVLALEGDPAIPCGPEVAAEVARRSRSAWLVAGHGPRAAVVADAASALDAAFAGQEPTGFVEDLVSGRLMTGVEARNEIPGRLAAFVRVERHVALAPLEGGLVTRGLAKFGMPEVAIACEEARRLAAALVLRRAVRDALLSGRPFSPDERRALEGGLSLSVLGAGARGESAFLAGARAHLAAHARAAAALCPYLPAAVEVLEAALLDARGEADTQAVLDAIPAPERLKVRATLTAASARALAEALAAGKDGAALADVTADERGASLETAGGDDAEDAGGDAEDDDVDDLDDEGGMEGEGLGERGLDGDEDQEEAGGEREEREERDAHPGDDDGPDGGGEAPEAEASGGSAPEEPCLEVPAPDVAFAAWAGAPGPEGADGLAALFSGRPAQGMDGGALEGRVAAAGVLELPSGAVVACDALTDTLAEPLPVEVSPGGYPVYLALARPAGGAERVAAAALVLSAEPPARWERAWKHDVDSGSSAFLDRQVGLALAEAEATGRGPGEALARALGDHTGALVTVGAAEDGTRVNAALFAAGFGDGTYLSYIARDAAGAPVAVVTGFAIVLGDAPREGDRKAMRKPPGPPPGAEERATLDTLLRMLNMDRRMGGRYDEVAAALGSARLERRGLPGGDAEGAEAIAASLAAHPLEDEVVFAVEPRATATEASAVFAWRAAPRTRVGTVRCEFKDGAVVRLVIEVDRR